MDLSMAGEQQLHQIASLSVVAWAQDWMILDVFPWRSQTLHIQRTLKGCNMCVFVTSASEQVWFSLVDNPYQHIYAFHFISPLLYCLQVHTSSPVTFNLVEFQSNSNTSGFIYEEVPFLLRGFVFGGQIKTNILHFHLQLLGSAKSFDPFGPAKVDLAVFQVSNHPRSPLGLRKNLASKWKTLYWLFNRDPYNGLLTSLYNWGV